VRRRSAERLSAAAALLNRAILAVAAVVVVVVALSLRCVVDAVAAKLPPPHYYTTTTTITIIAAVAAAAAAATTTTTTTTPPPHHRHRHQYCHPSRPCSQPLGFSASPAQPRVRIRASSRARASLLVSNLRWTLPIASASVYPATLRCPARLPLPPGLRSRTEDDDEVADSAAASFYVSSQAHFYSRDAEADVYFSPSLLVLGRRLPTVVRVITDAHRCSRNSLPVQSFPLI
jgi:hypothetical protein